ncbi:hypothetical protein [Dongia sedimenti]|uniref:DUF2975 domain-containing protein n=1 Tax=Dongia sedimenti TaxID=3064282 RepID=A0ABU0YJD6_9PROT|nr:hypothetical protein [Rhodospirillaceae bacterium R-7]
MMLREIWRTVLLMGLASRLYRDDAGSIYLIDTERWNKRPKCMHRLPDAASLDRVMQEKCHASAQMLLLFLAGYATIAVIRLGEVHLAWSLPILAPLLVAFFMCQRGVDVAMEACTTLPTNEHDFVLTRGSQLAQLKYVSLVRVLAALAIFAGFFGSMAVAQALAGPLSGPAGDLATGLSVMITLSSIYVIVAGGHVLNPDRIDLSLENR